MSLDQQIEGILFYKAEATTIKGLAKFFEVSVQEVADALTILIERLQAGATTLILTDTEVQLVTSPAVKESIEKLRKQELKKSIGKAGAETLAIILYRGPITRLEIDKIRGVNSSFILRNLLIRGLIEKRNSESGKKSFEYALTTKLYTHLGINKREEMSDFEEVMNSLDDHEEHQKEIEKNNSEETFTDRIQT